MNEQRTYGFGSKQQHIDPAILARAQELAAQEMAAQQHSIWPVKSFKAGAIQVSIWENENLGQDGKVQSYKTVSFERRYKDKTGAWKSTNTLRVNDLPRASLLLQKAFEYLTLRGNEGES